MSQSGAWNMRGIDQRARDAAREAALAEGVSLTEYLQRLIRDDSAPEPNEVRPSGTRRSSPDAATALDRLSRRIEATEARSTLAITGIDHTVLGLVSRLQNAEQTTAAVAGHVEGLIDEMRATHEALQAKVRRLEHDEAGQKSLDALKTLEDALGKLASHVYEEAEHAQNETDAIKGRVEAGFTDLTERVEGMESRVDRTLSDAAARVERAVEQAELRAEGTARHLADRMSTLEGQVQDKLSRLGEADKRLEAVEADVSGALSSMETTLLKIQDRLNRAETTTDAALKGLESTFVHLDQRIEAVAQAADPEQARRLRAEFDSRFEDMSRLVRTAVENARQELASEITRAAAGQDTAFITSVKSELSHLGERLGQLETQGLGLPEELIKQEIARLGDSVAERIDALAAHVDERIGESEDRSANAIEQVGEQVTVAAVRLQKRQDEALMQLAQDIDTNRKQADTRLSDALANISERFEAMQAQSATSLSPVQRAIAQLATRLESLEAFTSPPEAPLPPPIERPATAPPAPSAAAIAQPAPSASAIAQPAPATSLFEEILAGMDKSRIDDDDIVAPDKDDFTPGLEDWEVSGEPAAADPYADDFEAIRQAARRAAETHAAQPESQKATSAAQHDYIAELPAEDDGGRLFDPVAELDTGAELNSLEESRTEARESDIFDTLTGAGPDLETEPAPPPQPARGVPASAQPPRDYIAQARQAALAASAPAAKERGPRKSVLAAPAKSSGGAGKAPLYIAASAVVLTGAGAAGYLQLRGKQEPSPAMSQPAAEVYADPGLARAAAEGQDARQAGDGLTDGEAMLFEPSDAEISTSLFGEETQALADNPAAPSLNVMVPAAEALAETRPEAPPELARAAPPARPVSANYPAIQPVVTLESEAAAGNAVAQYELARKQIAAGDTEAGLTWLRRAAQKGLAAAQYELGKMHERGEGTAADLAAARTLISAAARSGHVAAMYDYALFLAEGDGGYQSGEEARDWFERAARYGFVDAQYNLGVLHAEGIGTSKDIGEALFWFELAAAQGDASARAELPGLKAGLPMDVALAARQRVAAWRPETPPALANGRFGAQRWKTGNPLQVQGVQTALGHLGHLEGVPDGVLGPATARAIRAYQSAAGLAVTGTITPELVDSLNARAERARS